MTGAATLVLRISTDSQKVVEFASLHTLLLRHIYYNSLIFK